MPNAFIDNHLTNFSHLLHRVPNTAVQASYVSRWRAAYVDAYKKGGEYADYEWNVRTHKSLKEVFTSVSFYQEALIAKEAYSWSAFFFLSYYSMFHALMSCVVLLPTETIEKISAITHSKLINVFQSTFCDASPHILRKDTKDMFGRVQNFV